MTGVRIPAGVNDVIFSLRLRAKTGFRATRSAM